LTGKDHFTEGTNESSLSVHLRGTQKLYLKKNYSF